MKASSNIKIHYADWGRNELTASILSPFVDYRKKIKQSFRSIFHSSDIILLNSARGGLHIILEALAAKYPDKNEVIVPEYICPSVSEKIMELGLIAVKAAIGDDLNMTSLATEQAITSKTLAVICVHMYGCPAPIRDIEAICKQKRITLIDDAAQLGGTSRSEQPLGSFGDFGLISFAQSKSIVTGVRGSGGILLVNNNVWKKYFSEIEKVLPKSKGRIRQLLFFLMAYIYGKHFGIIFYYWRQLKSRLSKKQPQNNFYEISNISNIEAAIAYSQLQSLPKRMAEKISLLKIYNKKLNKNEFISLPQIQNQPYLTRLIIRIPKKIKIGALRNTLSKLNIQTRLAYPGGDQLLEIPCCKGMNVGDIDRVCQNLHSALIDQMGP